MGTPKNFEDLTADELSRLLDACEEYLELGHCLFLKEEFRKFFDVVIKDDADAFIDYFEGPVIEYGIPELKEFCKTLNNWRIGILSYYDHYMSFPKNHVRYNLSPLVENITLYNSKFII